MILVIDQLLPVIQPADWGGAPHCVCRRFFLDDAQSPLLVSYAVVTPESNANLMPEVLGSSGRTAEVIEAESIARWVASNQNLNWESLELPGESQNAMAVRGESDIVSSILLSHGHLKGMHKYYGAELINILIPDRFTVIVHPGSLGLNSLAEGMYRDALADGTQLSPLVFQSMNGVVVSYSQSTPGPAEEVDLMKAASIVIGGAFLMVASADGSVGDKEAEQFEIQLNQLAQSGNGLAHQACTELIRTEFAVITEFVANGVDPMVLFAMMQKGLEEIDGNASAQDAAVLREAVRYLAKEVAMASGSGLMGLGSKISKNEKTALELLEALLAK